MRGHMSQVATASGRRSGCCPLAPAWPVGSAPLAWILHQRCNQGSAEIVQTCPPLPFLLFRGKNNGTVRRDPKSISRGDRRPPKITGPVGTFKSFLQLKPGPSKIWEDLGKKICYKDQAGGWNSQFLDSNTWIRANLEDKLTWTLADLTKKPEYGTKWKKGLVKITQLGRIHNRTPDSRLPAWNSSYCWLEHPCPHAQHLKCITNLF